MIVEIVRGDCVGYEVKNIKNDRYDLYGVKLENGKSCCYWKNKGNVNINTVVVIFNNNNVVSVLDNEICISLDSVKDYRNQYELLKAFLNELVKNGVSINDTKFNFVVTNSEEKQMASMLAENLGVKAVIESNFDDKTVI